MPCSGLLGVPIMKHYIVVDRDQTKYLSSGRVPADDMINQEDPQYPNFEHPLHCRCFSWITGLDCILHFASGFPAGWLVWRCERTTL